MIIHQRGHYMRNFYAILVKHKCLTNNEFFIVKYVNYKINMKQDLMLQTVLSGFTIRNYFEHRPIIAKFVSVWLRSLYALYDYIRCMHKNRSEYI